MIFLIVVWLPLPVSGQQQVLEIIQLSNRPAEEVVDLILPFLDPGGTAMPSGTQLIVKTSPENMDEVLQLIDQLDQQLGQFQISVLQSSRRTLAELNAESSVYGAVSSHGGRVTASGHLYQSDSKSEGEMIQQLQTLEGKGAHIQVGQSVPVYTPSGFGQVPYPADGAVYQEATAGFEVIPRMMGDQVLLEVSPWSDRLSRLGGGVIQTQRAHTTILAPLGQWVNFGGQDNSRSSYGSGILNRYEGTNKDSMKIYIKVDRIR